ncbi:MAG: putative baseplate assembly protein [Pseudomonadota bacterium]
MSFDPARPTPEEVFNRPGLSRLARRAGTHGAFREAMIRGLASANRPGLSELRTREEGDFTVALIDAWATVCDTLTFYVERSANEAYLRTATERWSLRQMARLIGYEPAPAKAASVFLAFEAEEGDAPEETLIYEAPVGVRSVPRDGALPQYFETIETLTARAEWNAMRPRLTRPQVPDGGTGLIQLVPEAPRLRRGDPVVFLKGRAAQPIAPEGAEAALVRRVSAVEEGKGRRIRVSLVADPPAPPPYLFVAFPAAMFWSVGTPMTSGTLAPNVSGRSLSLAGLSTTTALTGASLSVLTKAIAALPLAAEAPVLPHAMRAKAACFGHNAVTRLTSPVADASDNVTGAAYEIGGARPGAVTDTAGHVGEIPPTGKVFVYLDREYDEIVEDSAVVLRRAGRDAWAAAEGVETVSVEAYGLSARVTRLTLPASATGADGNPVALSGFPTRGTTVLTAPEALQLSDLPIENEIGAAEGDIGADEVELDGPCLSLLPGKKVAVTGERADLAGVVETEVKEIADNTLADGRSLLRFTAEFSRRFVRETVTMTANVAEATHGETVAEETLGDGDGARPFQTFALKSRPLTHVSACNAAGMAPALELRVDGVAWTRVEDFRDAGPEDRVYILRIAEDGTASVTFGDGTRGARPPTGRGNIVATYRKGAGQEGMLEAGRLTLLAAKPAGLKSVTNPRPPSGGAPAETLAQARENAPLEVLTLGRVVSLRDYEDFARGFAAIAKARADWAWDGFDRVVHLTVAGTGGVALPETGTDMTNLVAALKAAGEADIRLRARNFRPARFKVRARLHIDPARRPEDVLSAAEAALRQAYSFDARALGQGVSQAGVIAALQGAAGVRGVDLDLLHRSDAEPALKPRLTAAAARPGLRGAPEPAELLTLSPEPAVLEIA